MKDISISQAVKGFIVNVHGEKYESYIFTTASDMLEFVKTFYSVPEVAPEAPVEAPVTPEQPETPVAPTE